MSDLEQKKLYAAAFKRYEALQRDECIDPDDLVSRPIPKQVEVFKGIKDVPIRAVVAANQTGKSTMGGREVAWLCENKHPFVDTIDMWNTNALTILVIGQVGEQNESNLWAKKIKPFLAPGTYKEVRQGNALQRVEFKNGTVIIFISHHNANEARKTVQGYVAHYVWLDEMPNSLSLVAELQTRIISAGGRLLMTFTPLLRNVEIKNIIDSLKEPNGKRYHFNTLDNPKFQGREAEILAQFASYPEAERRARLYGEWYAGDLSVYNIDTKLHVTERPDNYSPQWDHLEAVDPAASGKMGYVLMARDPADNVWYVVKSKHFKGAAASDLLTRIESESAGHKIVTRVSDPHEVWFIKEAFNRGINYIGVYNKSHRKNELIKGVQVALNSGALKISKGCTQLLEELVGAQWSETVEGKIVGSTHYHCLDSLQYALDNLPSIEKIYKPLHEDPVTNMHMEIRQANNKRKEAIERAKERTKIQRGRRSRWSRHSARSS